MIDPDQKGRRPEVGLAGWREAVAMASTYPAPGGLGEEGTRGSQPGKLPSKAGCTQALWTTLSYLQPGDERRLLGISEGQPITSAHGPGNVT